MAIKHAHQIDSAEPTPDDAELGVTEWNDDHPIVEGIAFRSSLEASDDTFLIREADNVLAMRDGTSPQMLRVYNTFSGGGSNHERVNVNWSSNEAFVVTAQGGTGTARPLNVGTQGSNALRFRTNGSNRWEVGSGGHLNPISNNTYDLGTTGARVRDGWFSRSLATPEIVFPATQVPNAGANVLDDYEEGTWTPVLGGSGGESGQTYGHQVGRYIKIGKLVMVQCSFTLTTKGTITGDLVIKGLPFTSENTSLLRSAATVGYYDNMAPGGTLLGYIRPNESQIVLTIPGTSIGTAQLSDNSTQIWTATYRAAN